MAPNADGTPSAVFLDTTVICERVLASQEQRRQLESLLSGCSVRATSRFVQLEFKIGPFQHIVGFQADAESGMSYDALNKKARRFASVRPGWKQRRVGELMQTMLERFREEGMKASVTSDAPLPLPCPAEELVLRLLKDFFGLFVRTAWSRAFCNVEPIIDPSGCLADLPAPTWDEGPSRIRNELPKGYLRKKVPHLAEYVRREKDCFQRIASALAALPKEQRDEETTKRARAIRLILRRAGLTVARIRQLGDALIAVECPADHVLLSSNVKHFMPIAKAIGKACRSWSELPSGIGVRS